MIVNTTDLNMNVCILYIGNNRMHYNSVGGAVSIPLVTLFMFNRLIC